MLLVKDITHHLFVILAVKDGGGSFHFMHGYYSSIYHPYIGGKFTATPGVLTNIFYGCID